MKRRWITRADLWVIGLLLLLSASLFFLLRGTEQGERVSVYVGNELYAELSLTAGEQTLPVQTENGTLLLSIDDGGVCVLHADCPDAVCVRTGKISRKGESIVCVPLGVCITVGDGTLDGVTG